MSDSENVPNASGTDEETALQRGLTSGQIAMIGLSGALGTGLFLGSGEMIALAGPGVIISTPSPACSPWSSSGRWPR